VNLRSKRQIVGATFEMNEVPFSVELVVGANYSHYRTLQGAINYDDPAANKKRDANT
jgi:hypothetical protein